jgi:hypothetical protein
MAGILKKVYKYGLRQPMRDYQGRCSPIKTRDEKISKIFRRSKLNVFYQREVEYQCKLQRAH